MRGNICAYKKNKRRRKKSREQQNNALSHARLVVRHRFVGVVRRLRHLSGAAVRFIIKERENERSKYVAHVLV